VAVLGASNAESHAPVGFIAEPGSPGSIGQEGAEPNAMAAVLAIKLHLQRRMSTGGQKYFVTTHRRHRIFGHVSCHGIYEVVDDPDVYPNIRDWY
jgi:hypothetical protein